MRKICKIISGVLIYTLLLGGGLTYSEDAVCLRIPLLFNDEKQKNHNPNGQETKILSPEEGILQLKTEIAEVAYAHKDDKTHTIVILIDGEHGVGKSTFIETFYKSLNLPGWPVDTDEASSTSKKSIYIWQAWNGIGTRTQFGPKRMPDQYTVIAVYLSNTNDKSKLLSRIVEHADIIIDSRASVRMSPKKMAELLGSRNLLQKDI